MTAPSFYPFFPPFQGSEAGSRLNSLRDRAMVQPNQWRSSLGTAVGSDGTKRLVMMVTQAIKTIAENVR